MSSADVTEAALSIGELARQVGAAPSALRYWERAGLLTSERVDGRRRYAPEAAERVGLIRVCQEAGFGISEIRSLLAEGFLDGTGWRPTVEAKIASLRAEAARLEAAATALAHTLTCPSPTLSTCPTFTQHLHHHAITPR